RRRPGRAAQLPAQARGRAGAEGAGGAAARRRGRGRLPPRSPRRLRLVGRRGRGLRCRFGWLWSAFLIDLDLVWPVAAAMAAGGLIGVERTYHGHPAGFRTHILVCLTSCVLMLAAMH